MSIFGKVVKFMQIRKVCLENSKDFRLMERLIIKKSHRCKKLASSLILTKALRGAQLVGQGYAISKQMECAGCITYPTIAVSSFLLQKPMSNEPCALTDCFALLVMFNPHRVDLNQNTRGVLFFAFLDV
jgi:hypothetical protein